MAATVKAHGRAKKIKVVKFKRRKNYLRRHGHRQEFTELEIRSITASQPRGADQSPDTADQPQDTATAD